MSIKTVVSFKKRNVAGECRALRCKGSTELQEFDRVDQPTVLLCPKHHARACEHNPAVATTVPDKLVPRIATDGATGDPIFSLDDGKTWAFGEPPDDEPEAPADELLGTNKEKLAEAFASQMLATAQRKVEPETGRTIVSHDGGNSWAYVDSPEAAGDETPPPPVGATTVVVEHADVTALVAPLATEYGNMAPQLVGFVVNDQATVDAVGQLLLQVKGKLAELEKGRKLIVRPLLDAKKAVDDLFRPATDAAKHVEGVLKSALGAFVDRQQAAQVAALAAGQHEAALATVQPIMPKGVTPVTVWKWRITDLRLIPADYLVVDSAKVQARVNELKGACDIPGVETFPETNVRAATK